MDMRLADGRAYGRCVLSRRNLEIVWTTFLRRQPAMVNLLTLPWSLVPPALAEWPRRPRTRLTGR